MLKCHLSLFHSHSVFVVHLPGPVVNLLLFIFSFFSSSAHRSERCGRPAGHPPAAAQRSGVLAVRRLAAVQKPTVRPQEEGGGERDGLLLYYHSVI